MQKAQKIIERAESTTHCIEFMFHLIKNENEAANVKKIIGDKSVITIAKSIDRKTYQPILYFAIPEENRPMTDWAKYVVPLVLISDVKV